ncbi:MAG: DUF29 domain-containing protein [Acetobacteraceae bacterium]|jgi:hypothetical protein
MPDDLYDRDILTWSRHQADLLRRLARGERVDGVDWEHVVEEIEDVGLAELNAVLGDLRQMLVHLLKIQGWPDNRAADDWRGEIGSFQADAAQRFAPSMRRRINMTVLYDRARAQLKGIKYDGVSPGAWPNACPFTLNDLLETERTTLEGRMKEAVSGPQAWPGHTKANVRPPSSGVARFASERPRWVSIVANRAILTVSAGRIFLTSRSYRRPRTAGRR